MSEPNRQAIDTIRGYLYQFDNTILQILNHEDENASFTVEGIEDIDIEQIGCETVAIQCKYYEKSDFTPSKIKEAIVWMVKDFSKRVKDGKELIQYKLFGHYKSGQDKILLPISIAYLKESLLTSKTQEKEDKPSVTTKIHEELSLNDENLELFLSKLTLNIDGQSLDQQHESILQKLSELNICSSGDAEFFYAKSIYIIRNLAKNQLETERKITKSRFIGDLKYSKKMIFDHWYLERISGERYSKSIRKRYFNNTQSKFNRFFLIDASGIDFYEIKNLLKSISHKWSNQHAVRQVEKFCPYVYLHNFKDEDLCKIKKELISENFLIEDGYYYKGSSFDPKLFIRDVVDYGNPYRVFLKIINDLDDFNQLHQEKISNKYIYQMYSKNPFIDIDDSFDIYFSNLDCLRRMICE
ncbi:hypothetical protein MUB05_10690 [Acinetobacter indicus]|uniref:DUF4297 family anti-phage-associated protein n=2 Tax=Moraxellaceae TaxID=468 RepID=UPI0005F77EC9|nr:MULTISPECIES: DUF4297 family anti-phage-associated protein [Acinetobacter]KJV44404.1 hypothetical protein VH96_07515 [Acinetobacter indicus]MCP0917048.1 hypothetical protein [Acinetobacter indicus]MCP0920161.1 hypothetical protein [Acinetobacter indicus]MCP0922828.1 hypothetical protein [Acinetobacter indicus]UNW10273.1 hypothetical protein MOW14_03610 [Acinetobacter indicus]